ncbi:MAG: LolA family protein [Alphaproteobacteria bacterium]
MRACLRFISAIYVLFQGGTVVAAAQDLTRYEVALNQMKTLEAAFDEATSYGETASGVLYVARPLAGAREPFGMLKLSYNPPKGVEVLADGKHLMYREAGAEEANGSPIASTPVAFLLKSHISFKQGITVQQVRHEKTWTAITVYQTENPDAGSLTLVFDEHPIQLKRWVVTDLQGVQTQVTLKNIKINKPLPAGAFRWKR